jgi:hypothetical protein
VYTLKTYASRYVFGSKYCNACHGNPALRNDLCRMIEGYFWENSDPHKIALNWGKGADPKRYNGFRSAAGQRAAEIGERLQIKDVATARECIGCHSVSVPESTRPQDFDNPLSEGVTCVSCHGSYRRWVTDHQVRDDPTWSGLTRAQKWVDYGMVDLWDPVVRAQTCMSCHIGDPDPKSGKKITHTMYAAGHPPLPSIEVGAFSQEQPQHWLYLRCKNDAARKRLAFNIDRLEQTEQVVVSGLAALSRVMELFEADANQAAAKAAWPELARFDCTACHHELKTSGAQPWRQLHKSGAAGRPAALPWPRALVRLGIHAANPGKVCTRVARLDTLLADFHAALTVRPFGDRLKIAKAAHAIVEFSKEPLAELSQLAAVKHGEKARVLDQAEAHRLLRRLREIALAETRDYESARQIGWAFRTIIHELWEVTAARPAANKALKVLAANQPHLQQILKDLDADLVLSLRERGGMAFGACPPPNLIMTFPTTPDQKPILGPFLEARRERIAAYDPEVFRRRLDELSQLVPAP